MQIIDIIETYREVATALTETYMTSVSTRLNEIMKVLTIIGTIFIPLTFLAGVSGMNFHHFPELDWPYAYPIFWAICIATAGGMIIWFRRARLALGRLGEGPGEGDEVAHQGLRPGVARVRARCGWAR